MIGCMRTRVRKQSIIALYFEFETVLKFYNLDAWWDSIIIVLEDHYLKVDIQLHTIVPDFDDLVPCCC